MQFAALLAILPVILLLIYIYKMDSYEKEPIKLLVLLVVFGVISAVPAIILEEIGTAILNGIFGEQNPLASPPLIYSFINTFFIVAISEELVKFLAAYILTWKNPAFNFKFDGIVYCFYASMGFALIENILYVFARSGGASVGTAIARALLAIPAHGMFSVFMGYYYGEAKFCSITGNKAGVKANIARGFLISILLHGFYDFCLLSGRFVMVIAFFLFVIIADIYTVMKISKASKTNLALYNTQYQPYWVTQGAYQQGMFNPAYSAPQGYGAAPGFDPYAQGYNSAPQGYNAPPQQGYSPNAQGYSAQGYAPANQNFNAAPQGYNATPQQGFNPYAQGYAAQGYAPANQNFDAAPQGYGNPAQNFDASLQSAAASTQDAFAQPAYNQADAFDAQQPISEQHTSILRREPPRMIYCPNCHNICDFNSFFCGKCSTPIHNFGAAM